jgi:hypothetical protein
MRAFPLLAPKAPGRSGHGPAIGEAKGPAYPLGLQAPLKPTWSD